jgi:hypothetical protein
MKHLLLVLSLVSLPALGGDFALDTDAQFERGKKAIHSMAGCFLIDYSYTETEGLKPGYERDKRVYDVNADKSVKEWIYVDEVSPKRFRVQHVMFVAGLDGKPIEGTTLKHTGEDWEYEAPFEYEFKSPLHWEVRALGKNSSQWTRRVTNLDDGLRYQCSAPWNIENAKPEWTCSGYAPIPGREFRDMGRKDYQGLERTTRIISYGDSFIERQMNTKVIHDASGKTPLAKELGKNWYVRLPDAECAPALSFAKPRLAFWSLMRETWDEVLNGQSNFVEKKAPPGQSRYFSFLGLEEKYASQNLREPSLRAKVKSEMQALIESFRER